MGSLIGAGPRNRDVTDGNDVDADAVETTATDEEPDADVATAAPGSPERPPDGYVRMREALVGVGLLWLAAVAGVGAVLAAVYGTTSPAYLAVAVAALSLSAGAGYASLRTFGYA